MSKRFTTQEKWDNLWYRKLSPINKCFFEYIYTRCSHSGMWQVDFETAEHFIGSSLNVDEIKRLFKGKYIELQNGSLWFLPDYIRLQHSGKLSLTNPAQKKAYEELLEIGLINDQGTLKLLPSSFGGAKEIEEDKVISKEKDKSIDNEIDIDKNIDKDKDKAEDMEEELTKEVRDEKVILDKNSNSIKPYAKTPEDLNVLDYKGRPIYQ